MVHGGAASCYAKPKRTPSFMSCQLLCQGTLELPVRFQHQTVRLFVGRPLTVGGAASCVHVK